MPYSCPAHGLRSGQDICTICNPQPCKTCGKPRVFNPPMTSDKYESKDPHAGCKWYAEEYDKDAARSGLRHETGRVVSREQVWQ